MTLAKRKLFNRPRPVRDLSDAEEAAIQQKIAIDLDNPELTDEQLANLRPFSEVFPEMSAAIRKKGGRPKLASPKEQVTIRLSADVLSHFREMGPGWQTRIDEVLKAAIGK